MDMGMDMDMDMGMDMDMDMDMDMVMGMGMDMDVDVDMDMVEGLHLCEKGHPIERPVLGRRVGKATAEARRHYHEERACGEDEGACLPY